MFEAMAFKNSNKASWLPAALENEKNEAVSGGVQGASGALRGPAKPNSRGSLLWCWGTHLQWLSQDEKNESAAFTWGPLAGLRSIMCL